MNKTAMRAGSFFTFLTMFVTLSADFAACFGQDTAFTYQGRVTDNGTNFTGVGQFEFALVTSTNNSVQATALATNTSGFITGIGVVNGGRGYTVAPTVTINPPGGSGTVATATATISGGVVVSITVNDAGTGYSGAPVVTVAPPPADIIYSTYWSNDGTDVGTSSGNNEPATAVNVAVSSGLFTVTLGNTNLANMTAIPATVFTDEPGLQLQIWFNDGVSGFAMLSPLQNLTPTPYAVEALNASSASNLTGALPVAQLSGTLAPAQLPAGVVTNNETNVVLNTVTINGGLDLPGVATIYAGGNSLMSVNGLGDFFAGLAAGHLDTSGVGNNTALGDNALSLNATGYYNTAVGNGALDLNTGGLANTALGASALYSNSGNDNTAMGTGALGSNTSGSGNTAAGYQAMLMNTNGSWNTAEGFNALYNNTGTGNIGLGYQAGYNITSGGSNIDIGSPGLAGDTNIIRIGTGQSSTYIAGILNGNGSGLTSINAAEVTSLNTGYGNFYLGLAGDTTSSGYYNTAIGFYALSYNTSGGDNTAIGDFALNSNVTGSDNTAIGNDAMTIGQYGSTNTVVGSYALYYDNTGSGNTAIGYAAMSFLGVGNYAGGTGNIALGDDAGISYQNNESDNIDIGSEGVTGENRTIHLGTQGTQTTTYLSGNVLLNGGLNVDQNGQNSGNIYSNALTFGVSSGEGIGSDRVSGRSDSYGLDFYTDFNKRMTIQQGGDVGIGNTNPGELFVVGTGGAYCNGTSWVNGSDRNSKRDFTAVNPVEVLAKISALPISEWQYKVDAAEVRHIGPMAQDFHAAFGLNGGDDKHISTVDEGGVALAAIQGLNQKLETENQEKNAKIRELEARLNQLEKTVQLLAEKK
jgi:hypothetical protein